MRSESNAALGQASSQGMPDRRYGSKEWKRLRRVVLHRDQYECLVRGPRCTSRATTVHHLKPSSQRPDLFWEPSNLIASCGPCNYGGGSSVRAANERRRLEQLEEIIMRQDQQIQGLLEELSRYESERPNPAIARNHAKPAIY